MEFVGIIFVIIVDVEAAELHGVDAFVVVHGPAGVKRGAHKAQTPSRSANTASKLFVTVLVQRPADSFRRQAVGFDLDVAIKGAVGAAFAVTAQVTGFDAFGVNQFSSAASANFQNIRGPCPTPRPDVFFWSLLKMVVHASFEAPDHRITAQ